MSIISIIKLTILLALLLVLFNETKYGELFSKRSLNDRQTAQNTHSKSSSRRRNNNLINSNINNYENTITQRQSINYLTTSFSGILCLHTIGQ